MNIRLNAFFSSIIIGLCVFITYSPSLRHTFIWDDTLVVVNNEFIKSFNNIPNFFNNKYFTSPQELAKGHFNEGSGEVSYRPVVTISYMVDYSLWKLNPFGYHLMNIILHIINSILVFVLLGALNIRKVPAIVGALIFGLHPVQIEAVCNISFREDLLAFLFFNTSFLGYIKFRQINFIGYAILSLATFFLAVFSKEMAVTFPLLIIIYDWLLGKKEEQGKRNFYYLGMFIVLGFYLWVWTWIFPSKNETILFAGQTAFSNFLTMTKIFGIYIGWLIYPVSIHPTVPDFRIAEFSLFSFKIFGSLFIHLILLIVCLKNIKKNPLITFGIAWFYFALLPVSNIMPIQNVLASRYLYIPLFGFSILTMALLENIWDKKPGLKINLKPILSFAVIGIIFVYSITTFFKQNIYKNGHNFFKELSFYYPAKDWIHRGLGQSYIEKGNIGAAKIHLKEAIKLNEKDDKSRELLKLLEE